MPAMRSPGPGLRHARIRRAGRRTLREVCPRGLGPAGLVMWALLGGPGTMAQGARRAELPNTPAGAPPHADAPEAGTAALFPVAGGQDEPQRRADLAAHPDAAEGQYALAADLFHQHRAKDSLAAYTRAAQLRRPSAKDLQTVALDYVLLNSYADADKWMTIALQTDPGNSEAWYDLGRIKYTENRFAEAVAAFERSLALAPGSVKAVNNLGLAQEGLGRAAEARSSYEHAIAMQSHLPHPSEQPLLNLAILLVNQGDAQRALPLLTEAREIAPADRKIEEQMGRALERLGRLPEAEAALRQAVALSPNTSALHFQLGQVLKKEGKTEEAKAEFARVAALRGTESDGNP